jgi:RNA polymerase sigma-70 factor (ECF subfamily)
VTPGERLVEEHYADVYRLALCLTGDRAAAEDLTRDVFRRALRGLGRFRGDAAARTWLYRICLNEARRRRPRLEPADSGAPDREHDPAPGPEDETIRRLDHARLHRLIRMLPDPYRQAVVLPYVHGLEVREVGSLLGAGENTLKTWLLCARRRLRAVWGGDDHAD